jgi:hypothetical protein
MKLVARPLLTGAAESDVGIGGVGQDGAAAIGEEVDIAEQDRTVARPYR